MTRPTVLSLFSGIGGLDLGLQRAGWQVVGQVENDPYCIRVLEKHWPDVPRWGDIREVDPDDLPRADLVAGGFPCQDTSDAGPRAGLEGLQSGLWAEFARVVRGLRPRHILVENTTGLLARGMGTVLADLAASGYDAEWDCLPAAAVGAPHLRARLWIVADAGGQRAQTTDQIPAGWDKSGLRDRWPPEPRVGRVVHGLPTRMDLARLRGLGNAVVPQVAEHIGRLILAAHQREHAA